MATTITGYLMPNPIWYFADLSGKPLAGGSLYLYNGQNQSSLQPAYVDPGCQNPFPNPIVFDAAGSSNPIYFSDGFVGGYYLELYDAAGVLIRTVDNFFPDDDTGTGGDIVEVFEINNLLVNNSFYQNVGALSYTSTQSSAPITAFIAPSNHVGFSMPDIQFRKSNTTKSAVETLTVAPFNYGTVFNVNKSDPTPEFYLHYQCTAAGTGETYKVIQFPIQARLKTLEQQVLSISIYLMASQANTAVTAQIVQFSGSGGNPSVTVPVTQTFTLTAAQTWQRFTGAFPALPNVGNVQLGECGDDGYYLQIMLPLNVTADLSIAKPALYRGVNVPTSDFESYDEVESITDSARPGEFLFTTRPNKPGWIACLGTIGSPASNASYTGPTSPFFLYKALWESYGNQYVPTSNPGGRGVSAEADYTADYTLTMPDNFGRAFASAGTTSGGSIMNYPGSTTGAETQNIAVQNLPATVNMKLNVSQAAGANAGPMINVVSPGTTNSGSILHTVLDQDENPIVQAPLNIFQPTFYTNLLIKL